MSQIITLANLKSYLDISGSDYDTRLQFVVDGVNNHIETATGRVWGETVTVVDEKYDYKPVIFLKKPDVTAITTVKRGRTNPTTLSSDDYFFSETGRLVLSTAKGDFVGDRDDYDQLQVTYEHGVVTVPDDLTLAALMMAADGYRSLDGEVTEESIGSFRRKYATSNKKSNKIFSAYKIRRI